MQLLLYTKQEITRLFRRRRGLTVLVLFSILWTLVMTGPMKWISDQTMTLPTDAVPLEAVSNWSSVTMAAVWSLGLFIFPLVPLLLCTDLLVSDLQRGTVRFLLLRTTRTDLVLGRFLGQTINLTVLVYLGMTITIFLFNHWGIINPLEDILSFVICGANFLILCLPMLGMVTLFSTFATKPLRVMLWCVLFWSAASIAIWFAPSPFGIMDWLSYLIPGHQLDHLVQMSGWETFKLAPIALGQTVIFLFLTLKRLQTRDV